MKKLLILLGVLGVALLAMGQSFLMPPPAGVVLTACAQNTTIPTPVAGQGYISQCSYDGFSYTGTCSAACNGTAILSIDTAGTSWSGISIQTTSQGSGALTAQFSNDNTNWTNYNCAAISSNASVPPGIVSTNNTFIGQSLCPVYGRYFRLEFTSYSSGTFTVVAYGRTALSAGVYTVQGQVAIAPYPQNFQANIAAAPITAVGTGSTGAVTATLAGAAGKTTYICSFDITAIGGTAAIGPVTVGTLIGGNTFTYQMTAPTGGVPFSREFTPCIPTTAVNTAITITTTADGTATAVDVNAHGFQL